MFIYNESFAKQDKGSKLFEKLWTQSKLLKLSFT